MPFGAAYLPQNQDPTNALASTVPGATALPNDLMRPYQGYGSIRMWDYTGYGNYHSLQAGINRRFDNGFMFSAFYVWSKALTINNDDFAAAPSERERRRDQAGRLLLRATTTVRRTSSSTSSTRPRRSRAACSASSPTTGRSRASTAGRAAGRTAIAYSIPGIGNTNLTGTPDFGARVVVTCDPGHGSSSDPYRQIDTSCFAPPKPGSNGDESARFFLWAPPIVNLDMSVSKVFPVGKRVKMEVRLDMFNALNHTQFTGVNDTANFKSLTDPTITNLPYDASGNLVNNNGFGSINGVAPPRTLQLVTRLTF